MWWRTLVLVTALSSCAWPEGSTGPKQDLPVKFMAYYDPSVTGICSGQLEATGIRTVTWGRVDLVMYGAALAPIPGETFWGHSTIKAGEVQESQIFRWYTGTHKQTWVEVHWTEAGKDQSWYHLMPCQ